MLRLVLPGAGDTDGGGVESEYKGYNLGQSVQKKPDDLTCVLFTDQHLYLSGAAPHSPGGNEVVRINGADVSCRSSMPFCYSLRRAARTRRDGGITPDGSNG